MREFIGFREVGGSVLVDWTAMAAGVVLLALAIYMIVDPGLAPVS